MPDFRRLRGPHQFPPYARIGVREPAEFDWLAKIQSSAPEKAERCLQDFNRSTIRCVRLKVRAEPSVFTSAQPAPRCPRGYSAVSLANPRQPSEVQELTDAKAQTDAQQGIVGMVV